MLAAVRGCWALFLGLSFIMLGNGMQGTLIGIRMKLEGFETSITGLIGTGYFLGYLIGAIIIPFFIRRVGHIRIFGALASLASISILVHAVVIDPWVWFFMRLITGLAYAGLYVVCESWVNEASSNENRGKMMSVYMLVMMGSVTVATLALNLGDPNSFELFTLVSVMISLSVIPILTSVSPAPSFEQSENATVKMVYTVSPLGVVGMFLTNFGLGSAFMLGAIYAANIGLSIQETTFMITAYMGGTLISQWPIGWLSDRLDRRKVLAGVALASAVAAAATTQFVEPGWQMYLAFLVLGGLSQPLYSLCIAHTNDYLNPAQMVAASGTMVMIGGVGALLGPAIVGYTMEFWGDAFYLLTPGAAFTIIFVFALYRMTQRASIPVEEQADHVILSPNPLSAVLNPDVDVTEWQPEEDDQPDTVEELFEEFFEPDEGDNGPSEEEEANS
ncbi:MFS transporter [Curvivirga aplysinae]|uniref:MFS transporter n=1 Tax=Curvivirga aplysinae TaxID=2529852 RepID=UPI0012BBCB65|nr:MFS transporter [Curvivirga aplysinae]MTI09458.1 MFS transporter [Curvivirga aplysinae]